MQALSCPALFISAPGSSHGKTTVTAALARFHAKQGRKVRVFKAGPDFLDPMILEHACNQRVYQLDLWMAGEAQCRNLVYQAAQDADLILIEGVMGLFDGKPCSADLAQSVDAPILAVIDAAGVAQTLGAIGYGLAHFRPGLRFAGVFANGVASPRHEEMIREGLASSGMHYFGGMPRDTRFSLPARHLGLLPAQEIADLESRLSAAAEGIASSGLSALPPLVSFADVPQQGQPRLLEGIRIGVARDTAFSFLYPVNLDLLHAMGATLLYFSPLNDRALPEVDSIYLPGGYPEMHLQQLQDNKAIKSALLSHFEEGKPIYAECGGLLYLLESITDKTGARAVMAGLLPGHAVMQTRLQGLGYQTAPMSGGALRGHTFHYSAIDTMLTPMAVGQRLHNTSEGERIFRSKRLTASYLHCYFPSNPQACAELFLP